ncbi:MAG: LSU ribosomal protein L29p (L35e), partial [uncultured Microvirga sp.]
DQDRGHPRQDPGRAADAAPRPAEGAVQPALPAGHRAARGDRPHQAGAARHRPHQIRPVRAASLGSLSTHGL